MSGAPEKSTEKSFADVDLVDWAPMSYALKFPLWRGLQLGEIKIRTQTCKAPLSRFIGGDAVKLPCTGCPKGIDAFFVPAQPVFDHFSRLSITGGRIRYAPKIENRFYIMIEDGFDAYLRRLSSKTRANLNKHVRALSRASHEKIDWGEFRTADELAQFHSIAYELSKKTYQDKVNAGLPDAPKLRELICEQSSDGRSIGYILFFEGKPIAYNFCIVNGDTLIGSKSGFDNEFSKWSPGLVLIYLIVERLFAQKQFRVLDMGQSEYAYKSRLATGHIRCARTLYLRQSPILLAFACAHYVYSTTLDQTRRIFSFLVRR